MDDPELQAKVAKQVREKLAELATKLRDTGEQHGPVIGKTLNLIAEQIDQLD